MSKKLVAYFSASGVTAKAAGALAAAAGAALYEIKPQTPYTDADLNWMDKKARSTVEMNDRAFRPALADTDAPVADYDVIFVGSPNWCGTIAPPMAAFLAKYKLDGKVVAPFYSHCGGGEKLEQVLRGWLCGLDPACMVEKQPAYGCKAAGFTDHSYLSARHSLTWSRLQMIR